MTKLPGIWCCRGRVELRLRPQPRPLAVLCAAYDEANDINWIGLHCSIDAAKAADTFRQVVDLSYGAQASG